MKINNCSNNYTSIFQFTINQRFEMCMTIFIRENVVVDQLCRKCTSTDVSIPQTVNLEYNVQSYTPKIQKLHAYLACEC